MWRNILVQSTYQIILLLLLLLRSAPPPPPSPPPPPPSLTPLPLLHATNRVNSVFDIMSFWTHSSGSEAVAPVEEGSVRHLTIIFNAFVFCQIFNEFNARYATGFQRFQRFARLAQKELASIRRSEKTSPTNLLTRICMVIVRLCPAGRSATT